MRVITGTARGRKLKTPVNYDVRPTTDNVKESIFNILNSNVEGRRVLDLFAGTGQLGIEAISRGASDVVFVDSSEKALRIVRENLDLCHFKAKTIRIDALDFLSGGGTYDLIFVDPPYDSNIYENVLKSINSFDILTDSGIIIVESRAGRFLPEMEKPYYKLKEYKYGSVKITTYSKNSDQ